MNKRINVFIYVALVLFTACAYYWTGRTINRAILTDSGFDYSYSGGGGGYSGSSWSGGDYHSYGSSRSYSPSDGSSSDSYDSRDYIFFGIMFSMIIFAVFDTKKQYSKTGGLHLDKKLSKTEEEIRKVIPDFDLEKFLNDRFIDYKNIQSDWSKFNYEGLRERLTDELYNQYCMQLKTLEVKEQKNVMHSFTNQEMMVTSVKEVNGRYEIKTEYIISQYDFIEQKGKLVRGNKRRLLYVHYEMVFVSSSDDVVRKCPTCGAELGNNATEECPFCHNVISRLPDKWLLSKKQVINQR